MNLKLVSVLSIVGLLAACGDSGSSSSSGGGDTGGGGSDNGGGGNGGDGGSAGPQGPTTPSTTTGGSGGGLDLECDDGTEPGDYAAAAGTDEGDTCSDCLDCAIPGPCGAALTEFQQEPGCLPAAMGATDNWITCFFGDDEAAPPLDGCFPTPALSDEDFEACQAACDTQYPNCSDLYLGLLSCAVCQQCPVACDGADTGGDGANCVASEE